MDLWIRSQDRKTMLQPNILDMREETNTYRDTNNPDNEEGIELTEYSVVANEIQCLGVYATKERALEVLDEIDEFIDLLNNNLLGLSEDGIHRKHSIYQMPKE